MRSGPESSLVSPKLTCEISILVKHTVSLQVTLLKESDVESMIEHRVEEIRKMMMQAGGKDADLPYVLIENSDKCQRNAAGEKVLANETAWIPAFFETVVEVAQNFSGAYRYDPNNVNRQAQLLTKFVLIPLILVFQVTLSLKDMG